MDPQGISTNSQELQETTLEGIELCLRRNFDVPPALHIAKCVITLLDESSAPGSQGALEPQEITLGPTTSSLPFEPAVDYPIPSIERAVTPQYGSSFNAQAREATVYGGMTPWRSTLQSTATSLRNETPFTTSTQNEHQLYQPTPALFNTITLPFRPNPNKSPRNPHTREDGLTDVCGVFIPATNQEPPQKYSTADEAIFYCPRCNRNFTRERSVKDHFLICVATYGNPKRLKYTDHPSMAAMERRRLKKLYDGSAEGDDSVDGDVVMDGVDTCDQSGRSGIDEWVGGQLIKQEDLGVDFANETSFPTLRSSMEASPRGSPSHIGDGLSEYMDRRRYRDETPTPTPTPAPAPNSF